MKYVALLWGDHGSGRCAEVTVLSVKMAMAFPDVAGGIDRIFERLCRLKISL